MILPGIITEFWDLEEVALSAPPLGVLSPQVKGPVRKNESIIPFLAIVAFHPSHKIQDTTYNTDSVPNHARALPKETKMIFGNTRR